MLTGLKMLLPRTGAGFIASTALYILSSMAGDAGVITGVPTGNFGNDVVGPTSFTTINLGNLNTGPGSNSVTANVNFVSFGPGLVQFTHNSANDAPGTAYLFHYTINNNSGQAWGSIALHLNTGFAFDLGTALNDPTPTGGGVFSVLNQQPLDLLFGNGTLPSGGTVNLTFSVDLPSGFASGLSSTTITPSAVPEPVGLLLLGSGLAAISLIGLRRRGPLC